MDMPVESPQHGTPKRYRAGCHCQECRDAWAANARAKRAEAHNPKPPANSGAADVAQLGAEKQRLAELWGAEPPAITDWRHTPTKPSEYACDECDAPMVWHSALTALACMACPASAVSPGAIERGQAHAASLERSRTRGSGTELAVIDPDAEDRARAARIRLGGQREALELFVRQLEGVTRADAHVRSQYKRLGFDIGKVLRGYGPEIRERCADEVTVSRIAAELEQIRTSPEYQDLKREAEEVQRQRDQEQWRADVEQQRAEQEAEQARLAAHAERQAAIEAQQQRKIIQGHVERKPTTMGYQGGNGYVSAGVMALSMIQKYQAEKERLLAERGPCGYEHRKTTVAERRYWITTLDWQGNQSGYALPDSPSAVVCSKHFAMANAWIEEQAALIARQRGANVAAVYTELT